MNYFNLAEEIESDEDEEERSISKKKIHSL